MCLIVVLWFQFQIGAIKGFLFKERGDWSSLFQFQIGAIKGVHLANDGVGGD